MSRAPSGGRRSFSMGPSQGGGPGRQGIAFSAVDPDEGEVGLCLTKAQAGVFTAPS